jgi:calcineurin-like phosphoesterase family protein
MGSRRYKGEKYRVEGKAILLSDPHFFHGNILKYDGRTQFMTEFDRIIYDEYVRTKERGPKISEEAIANMNSFIVDAINDEVDDPDSDTVIINGDFVFGNSPNQYRRNAIQIRDQINCRDVRAIWGNHDEPDEIADLFKYTYEQTLMYIGKQPCFFNHFPMTTWDGPKGTILLHGHVHGLYEEANHPHPIARPQLWLAKDLGVNTNGYKPYTMEKIQQKLQKVRDAQEAARAAEQHHLMW